MRRRQPSVVSRLEGRQRPRPRRALVDVDALALDLVARQQLVPGLGDLAVLHVLAGALFGKKAFQNVIVNGIVLAEDGKKMSKKLQNYPDPMTVVEKYGADALRFYLLSSPVVQAENLEFSEKGVDEVAKKNIGKEPCGSGFLWR